jgi:hypothetical protein
VSSPQKNLLSLLESKRGLFKDMEKVLNAQKKLLAENEFDRFCDKSDDVDGIIEKIKNVDYDIAYLESGDESLSRMINTGNVEVKKLLNDIIKISKRNHDLVDELTEKLNKSYQHLKKELGDTVDRCRIGGYKTAAQPSPVYFDKTS